MRAQWAIILLLMPFASKAEESASPETLAVIGIGKYGASPGPEWHRAKKDKDILVFSRVDKQTNTPEARAFLEMDAPPEAVFAVVTDFAHYPEFMPYTKTETVLQRPSPDEYLAYSVVATPVVSKRDSVVDIKVKRGTKENGGVFRSEWVSKPDGAPKHAGMVRVRVNSGYWLLEPIDRGKRSRVTYDISTDPGGNVPHWILDASTTMALPDMLRAVSKRAVGKAGAGK